MNISALSLYTSFGFLVTSRDSDKTPIMSLQVLDTDIRVSDSSSWQHTLRHGAGVGATGAAGDDDGEDTAAASADDGNSYSLRPRAKQR